MSFMLVEKDYWNGRYASNGTSGEGSYGDKLNNKLEVIKQLEEPLTIFEVGCGDFNFGKNIKQLFPKSKYRGVDISEVVVKRNTSLYGSKSISFSVSTGVYDKAELVMCVDVLFHIIRDEDYNNVLNGLKSAWVKHLVITACEDKRESAEHMNIRPFDPSFFGTPAIRQLVDVGTYLYVFSK